MLSESDLHDYQQRGVDFLYERDEALLLVKMGGGKTVISATALVELLEQGEINRALIAAPKRVAELVWPAELTKWEHLKHLVPSLAFGTPAKRRKAFAEHRHIVIIGSDNLIWAINEGLLDDIDALILDDCMPRGHTGVLFKALEDVDVKIRWGMTGTVTSNYSITDLRARVHCVDQGRHLGRSMSHFRQQHMRKTGPNAWGWLPKRGALEKVMDRIKDLSYVVETYDGLPDVVINDIWVELPPAAREAYDEMEETFEWQDVEAVGEGVQVSKLQQIANGFLYGPMAIHNIHEAKLDATEEILESSDESMLIVYQYVQDLVMLRSRWEGPDLATNDTAYDDWRARELDLLYLHPQSAGHGLNLQPGGNTIIFYGLPWSLEHYEQTIARLARQGQEEQQVWVHRVLARNTIDEDIVRRQETNCSIREAVEIGLKQRQEKRRRKAT